MNKAVFLDRDGVINEDFGYVHKIDDFIFIEGIIDFCIAAISKGYLLIVITNQAGIAHGYYSEADFKLLNAHMLTKFSDESVNISEVYYCSELISPNRKPNPGMIFIARDQFNVDLQSSILVGDKMSDIEAGRRAGVGKLVLLKGRYDFICANDMAVCENFEMLKNFL